MCEDETCVAAVPLDVLIEATQSAQDAQAGYACDYQNKRSPMAFNEVKELMKGQRLLAHQHREEKTGKLGARLAKRLMSDAYCKGIVRGAVESTNLRVSRKDNE